MSEEQGTAAKDSRLYDLFSRFKAGDSDSYAYIIKRFAGLINKESYNCFLGILDEDLRAQIYLNLFARLQRFKIADKETIVCLSNTSD